MATDQKDLKTSEENRDRKQTEKGQAYKIELLEDQKGWSPQRAWMKQLSKIKSHLANTADPNNLQTERIFLETKME